MNFDLLDERLDSDAKIDRALDVFGASLQPPPDLTVSEWADQYRVLSREASALRGKWRTYHYQREPLDVLSPSHPCQFAVYKCASQVMKTELLLCFAGFVIHMDPGPGLIVEPRELDAKAISKDRIDTMIRDTPVVGDRMLENTLLHKGFLCGHFTLTGAISPSGLAMRPIRYLLLDEVDRYEVSAGKEGNPISLAIRRTDTFQLNRKIAICSSPTYPGNNIDLWYQESDQRELHVPCPLCGVFQVLSWSRIDWPEGEPQHAQYRCEHCQKLIPHFRKSWMVNQGRWIAKNPASDIPGFWLSKLYTLQGPSWGDLAKEFLKAQKNPELMRAFVNTVLAEVYEERHETAMDAQALYMRTEKYGPKVPEQVAALTCGVDVQGNRLEVLIAGWGHEEEFWLIKHFVIPGNPEQPAVWKELDELLQQKFSNEWGIELPIRATCVDSSDYTTAVYQFTKPRLARKIYAIKGRDGFRTIWPKRVSSGANKTPVWILGVDTAKSTIYDRLKLEAAGPGYCHYSDETALDYFEQLTAEKKYARYKNGYRYFVWRKPEGARNEALDLQVYAYAALHSLYSTGYFNLNREAEKMARICDERRLDGVPKVPMAAVASVRTAPSVQVAATKETPILKPRYNDDNPWL